MKELEEAFKKVKETEKILYNLYYKGYMDLIALTRKGGENMENGDITINVKLSMDKSSYDDTNTKIKALLDEFERLAMPLFKFLKENYHPHAKIEISDSYIKVVEDTICISKNKDLIKIHKDGKETSESVEEDTSNVLKE